MQINQSYNCVFLFQILSEKNQEHLGVGVEKAITKSLQREVESAWRIYHYEDVSPWASPISYLGPNFTICKVRELDNS